MRYKPESHRMDSGKGFKVYQYESQLALNKNMRVRNDFVRANKSFWYYSWKVLLGLLFTIEMVPLWGQTFPCDGSLLFSTNSGRLRTLISKVNFAPFRVVIYGRQHTYLGESFNALGFNPLDNYIYATRANSNEIVRLKSDNSFEVVGIAPNLDELVSTAGDCTPEGYYLCHDQVLNQILVFDVVDNFALVNQINLFWDPASSNSGSFTTRIDALVVDPTNPTVAYSYQGDYFGADLEPNETRGYLLQINLDFQSPNLGMVTPIGNIPRNTIRKIGTLMFGADGLLYAYGATRQGPNPTQNKLMTIDKFTGNVMESWMPGPEGINSDGCSCPYNLSFENLADPNFALCSDSETKYNLTINNRFFLDIPNTSVIDTFPEGMIISDISGDFSGNLAPGTGVGTRFFRLDNLDIPARSRIRISIEVEVTELPIKIIPNQAILTDLPERFGYEMVSDDPTTLGFVGDPTNIFSDPQRLEAFTVEVTNPADCLNPDGKMVISAPVLIPGVTYEVNMQNEAFVEFAEQVVIDERNSFELDSLFPGEYRLYNIKPEDSPCSFAMKDTMITIEAPNELIQAEVSTNSPICEGSTLELSAMVFPPEGSVEWSGPTIFRFDGPNLTVDSAVFEQSGTYEMVFTYGNCEQIRTVDVQIAPTIEANISSPDGFCERDTMRLFAEGAGNLQSYIWTDPKGHVFSDSIIEIPAVDFEQAGPYELVIDNGFCSDTTTKFIEIFPTTTLNLADTLTSNFCEPLRLNPKLSGNTNVTYAWTPSEGLSCSDCPNPEIELPIQSDYRLLVSNEFACQDSAVVTIFLEEETLLYVPNAFSPNGDGQNDYFQPFPNCGVATIDQFQIYDRFGSLVYSIGPIEDFGDPRIFWNGSINTVQANPGNYVWLLQITLIDETKRQLQGGLTILP